MKNLSSLQRLSSRLGLGAVAPPLLATSLVTALVLLTPTSGVAQVATTPVETRKTQNASTYAADRAYLAKWVRQRQYTNPNNIASFGAIRSSGDFAIYAADGRNTPYYRVVPYRGSLAVLGLLRSKEPGALETARNWNTWFFNHLSPNYGVPYDHLYTPDGATESACVASAQGSQNDICNVIDATDSGIATFFSALWATYQNGAPQPDFSVHKAQIDRLAQILLALRQSDGLYWAGEDNGANGIPKHVKYLEDQSEVWAGWRDLSSLYGILGDSKAASDCATYAAELRQAITSKSDSKFYGRSGFELYSWAKNSDNSFSSTYDNQPIPLNSWYPPTQAQMWPYLMGVVSLDDAVTKTVVQAVNNHWDGDPQSQWWTKLGVAIDPNAVPKPYFIDNGFINSGFAYAMSLVGEKAKVSSYLDTIKELKYKDTTSDTPVIPYPFTVDDAGWLLSILTNYADNGVPVVSITTPLTNQNLPKESFTVISGEASDSVSVAQVKIQLVRTRNGLKQFWNGSTFSATMADLSASLTVGNAPNTGWNYPISPALKGALDNGTYVVYAFAQDFADNQSPIVERTFSLATPNVAPTLVKMAGPDGATATVSGTPPVVSPLLNGQASADQFVTFTTTINDGNGNADLGVVTFILGSNATELRLTYDGGKNRFSVNGASGSFAPSSSGVLTTASGSLDCGASKVTRNGNDLAITWRLKINTSATLKQGLRLQAQDKAGARSAVLSFGSWTFSSASNIAPTLVSMTGPSGPIAMVSGATPTVSPLLNGQSPVGTFVNFTTTVRDGNGNADLDSIFFIVGSGAREVRLTYSAATNRLSAPGGSPGSLAPGSANILLTPGGALDCAATKVTRSGNDLTITWRLKVNSVVKQGLRLQVQDKGNVRSPAVSFGSWTFTGSATTTLTSPSAASS